jgi:hypothetical protein
LGFACAGPAKTRLIVETAADLRRAFPSSFWRAGGRFNTRGRLLLARFVGDHDIVAVVAPAIAGAPIRAAFRLQAVVWRPVFKSAFT